MQEFTTVSSSSYDPASLATKLTEKSAEGWTVVSIVSTGGDVTAFLSRESSGVATASAPAAEAPAAAVTSGAVPVVSGSVPVVEAAPAPEPAVAEPAGWAVAPEPQPATTYEPQPAATSYTPAPAAAAPAAASPAVPAVFALSYIRVHDVEIPGRGLVAHGYGEAARKRVFGSVHESGLMLAVTIAAAIISLFRRSHGLRSMLFIRQRLITALKIMGQLAFALTITQITMVLSFLILMETRSKPVVIYQNNHTDEVCI